MKIKLEINVNIKDWLTEQDEQMTKEEALNVIDTFDQWSDLFYDAKIRRIGKTNVFKGKM